MDSFLTKTRVTGAVVLILSAVLLAFWLRPDMPEPTVRTHQLALPGQSLDQLGQPLSADSADRLQSGSVVRGQELIVEVPTAVLPTRSESAEPVQPDPPRPPAPLEPTPAESPPAVVSASPAAPPAPPQPQIQAPVAPSGEVWVVQVAAFSTRARADAQQAKLTGLSLSTYVEQVRLNDKPIYRVRIGPFASETEAEAMRVQVVAKTGLEAKVYKQKRLTDAAAS
ncbi:MAG: SPOR domain-containing protein [Gammaproteobacteria bacterium]|nr:SPOR domain-containing protein [Gammaproteobacteria bacterium]